jgi:hypothetical protein
MNRRSVLLLAGLLALVAAPAWSQNRTSEGFWVSHRNAPPAPRIYFRQPPQIRYEPESRVYVVQNVERYGVDMFRTGSYWYMTRDGYWYRATSYRGPWRAVNPRWVPERVYNVPMAYWHFHPRGESYAYGNDQYDNGYERNARNTYYGYMIDVTNAPAPPHIYFRGQPDVLYVQETGAYVVDNPDIDLDMFRYGDYWYVSEGGYWYRSVNPRGPFVAIDARTVPEAVYDTPDRHWKHRPMREDRWDDRWNRGRRSG